MAILNPFCTGAGRRSKLADPVFRKSKEADTERVRLCADAHIRRLDLPKTALYANEKMVKHLGLYPRPGYRETGRRHENGFNRVYFRKDL